MMSDIRLLTSRSFQPIGTGHRPRAYMRGSLRRCRRRCQQRDHERDDADKSLHFSSPHPRSVRLMLGLYFALAIFSALLNEPHRQAIAAVAALVMHAAGKAAHQMDAEIANLCLRE